MARPEQDRCVGIVLIESSENILESHHEKYAMDTCDRSFAWVRWLR